MVHHILGANLDMIPFAILLRVWVLIRTLSWTSRCWSAFFLLLSCWWIKRCLALSRVSESFKRYGIMWGTKLSASTTSRKSQTVSFGARISWAKDRRGCNPWLLSLWNSRRSEYWLCADPKSCAHFGRGWTAGCSDLCFSFPQDYFPHDTLECRVCRFQNKKWLSAWSRLHHCHSAVSLACHISERSRQEGSWRKPQQKQFEVG